MSALEGRPEEYVEEPKGSRQFQRYVDGWPVGGPTWVRDGVAFEEIFERRAAPPEEVKDARDEKLDAFEAKLDAVLAENAELRERLAKLETDTVDMARARA